MDNEFEFNDSFDLEADENEEMLEGMMPPIDDDDDDVVEEKIELTTPPEGIPINDNMPEDVKQAIMRFNAKNEEFKKFINDTKNEQLEAEANSYEEETYDDDDDGDDNYQNESVETIEELDLTNATDVNDLEDFI